MVVCNVIIIVVITHTIKGVLHSGSASVSHTEGRGFDSLHLHFGPTSCFTYLFITSVEYLRRMY